MARSQKRPRPKAKDNGKTSSVVQYEPNGSVTILSIRSITLEVERPITGLLFLQKSVHPRVVRIEAISYRSEKNCSAPHLKPICRSWTFFSTLRVAMRTESIDISPILLHQPPFCISKWLSSSQSPPTKAINLDTRPESERESEEIKAGCQTFL